jgi:predicted deacylase
VSKLKKIVVLGKEILPGKTEELNLDVARLHTSTPIQVPVIVSRGKHEGPTLLLMAGVHGDEINGVEIIRRVIRKGWNKPTHGTVICIPIFNIFGFLSVSRELPDGRDLNRSFPGSLTGSLASQFAYHFMKEIAPIADYIVDFHTGSAQRSNFPQIRCVFEDEESVELAKVFNPPFVIHSGLIPKTLRETLIKRKKKILLFEGGKTNSLDEFVVNEGLEGIKRLMNHFGMRNFKLENNDHQPILIRATKWIRASNSGMFQATITCGSRVHIGTQLGIITDPFGKIERKVKSNVNGYVFCVNEAPIVHKGDAIFNIGSVKDTHQHGLVHGAIRD